MFDAENGVHACRNKHRARKHVEVTHPCNARHCSQEVLVLMTSEYGAYISQLRNIYFQRAGHLQGTVLYYQHDHNTSIVSPSPKMFSHYKNHAE